MALNENIDREEEHESRTSYESDARDGETWDFHDSSLTNGEVARGTGGEYLTRFTKSLNEILPQIAPSLQIKVAVLGRNQYPNLAFSAIAVHATMPELRPGVVSYHTLILEATGEPLKPKNIRLGQDTVQFRLSTGMAYDATLQGLVHNTVKAQYKGIENLMPYNAEVVPADVAPDDKGKIEEIVLNTAVALVSAIKLQAGSFHRLDLSTLDKKHDYSLQLAFGRHDVRDLYNRPQRANTMITFTSRKRNSAPRREDVTQVNTVDATAVISEVGGFVQPVWIPDVSNPFSFRRDDRTSQCLAAEFVITSVNTPHITSPAAVNLAISNFIALAEKDNWVAALLPQAGRSNIPESEDITSIGHLNVLANLDNENPGELFGSPALMKDKRYDLERMHSWISAIFHQGLMVSLDIPEQHPSSWYLDVYAAAANGDRDAERQIIDGFDEITGGRFSKLFGTKDHLFSQSIRLPMGYYMDRGNMQDIRDLDMTAMCVLHHKQPEMIQKYHRAMIAATSEAAAISNLADLEEIYQVSANHSVEFYGHCERVTFSQAAVEALAAAIADCRLPCTVESPLTTDYRRFGVVVPTFVQSSIAKVNRGYDNSRFNEHRFGTRRW